MNETLQMLDYKNWYYESAEKAGMCKIHETILEEDIPDQFRAIRKKFKGCFRE